MATLTTKLTLTSSDLLTDALNLSVTDSLTVAGQTVQKTIVANNNTHFESLALAA